MGRGAAISDDSALTRAKIAKRYRRLVPDVFDKGVSSSNPVKSAGYSRRRAHVCRISSSRRLKARAAVESF